MTPLSILIQYVETTKIQTYPFRAMTLNHVGWGNTPEEAIGSLMRFLVEWYGRITISEIKVVEGEYQWLKK